MRYIEMNSIVAIENMKSVVNQLIDKANTCQTIGISDNIIKIADLREVLNYRKVQKTLTYDLIKEFDKIDTELERGLDLLEFNCNCTKRK